MPFEGRSRVFVMAAGLANWQFDLVRSGPCAQIQTQGIRWFGMHEIRNCLNQKSKTQHRLSGVVAGDVAPMCWSDVAVVDTAMSIGLHGVRESTALPNPSEGPN